MKAPKRSGKFFELLMPLLMLLIWSCSATQVNPVQDAALRARLESIKKAAILKPDVQIERKKYAGEVRAATGGRSDGRDPASASCG